MQILADIVVEELQSQLYPKTDSVSYDSLDPHPAFQNYLTSLSMKPSVDPEWQTARPVSLKRPVSGSRSDAEDHDDPDLETFSAIESLLETLSVLNRLESSIDTVVQRVPGELHSLVEATLEEVSRCA